MLASWGRAWGRRFGGLRSGGGVGGGGPNVVELGVKAFVRGAQKYLHPRPSIHGGGWVQSSQRGTGLTLPLRATPLLTEGGSVNDIAAVLDKLAREVL